MSKWHNYAVMPDATATSIVSKINISILLEKLEKAKAKPWNKHHLEFNFWNVEDMFLKKTWVGKLPIKLY